jgi:hypothetical protein
MDSKDEKKKKESIDDILSDLNGLLNRMPSILDGIKMPQLEPAEFAKPKSEPKPEPAPSKVEPKASEPPAQLPPEADKTIVLESFSGLLEGSPEPTEKTEEVFPAPGAGAQAPSEKLQPQSLGDFMFGEGSQASEPEQKPVAAQEPEERPVSQLPATPPSGIPPELRPEKPAGDGAAPVKPSLSASDLAPSAYSTAQDPAESGNEPVPAAGFQPHNPFETVRDFGVPDIDALMQLSGDQPAPAAAQPASLPAPAAAAPEAAEAKPSGDDLLDFEEQLKTAGGTGGGAQEALPASEIAPEPELKEADLPPAAEPGPETGPQPPAELLLMDEAQTTAEPLPEAEPRPGTEPQPPVELLLTDEALSAAEPQPGAGSLPAAEPQPEPGPAAGNLSEISLENTVQLSEPLLQPEKAPEAEQPVQAEPPAPAETLQLEPLQVLSAAVEPVQDVPAAGAAEPAAEIREESEPQPAPGPGIERGSTLQFQAATPPEVQPASAGQDETLVVPSPGWDDGKKTVIMDSTLHSGVTSRSHSGALSELAVRRTPQGVPAERTRSAAFLYIPAEKALCATVLSELDTICLKSATKPMFVKRAYVKECAPDMNANYALQAASSSGAQALVCLGTVPPEKLFELESACSSSGFLFRHYDQAAFSHSSALDLVMEMILR